MMSRLMPCYTPFISYNKSLFIRNNTFKLSGCNSLRYMSSTKAAKYDVAVIGGGPGGYVAAIKAAQLGFKTVCIEKRGTLGGTCLNVGCIPSKSLLNITHKFHEASHDFKKMGITMDNLKIDVATMQKQKSKCVMGLTKGIEELFKMNKVSYEKGIASFINNKELLVNKLNGEDTIVNADNIIVATGSESSLLPGNPHIIPDEKIILTSTGALSLKSIPKKMVVIGGGVIGLELGSVYARLGTEILVIEFMSSITSTIDGQIAKQFQSILEKQGMKFHLKTKVLGVEIKNDKAHVEIQNVITEEKKIIECDKVLLSVGRRPYTSGLKLENIQANVDKAGRICVESDYSISNVPNVRAIGDCIHGPMLAHKAEEEGIAVAELIAGKPGHVNYKAIPSVVYTHPEVAGVGKTEEQLIEEKQDYNKGSFSFNSNSRARANDDYDGLVKILTDKQTDKILGAWILGPNAGELLQEIVLGIEYGASSEDIARTCHAHPTLSEAIKEACMSTHGKPIHGSSKTKK